MAVLTVSEKRDILNLNSVTFVERQAQLEQEEKARQAADKREKNSPFSRWSQFNLEHTKELMWLALNYPKAHAILYFLVDQMDGYNAVMCSYKVLEEVLGVGQATIARNIKILKDKGFISVLKSGISNVYAINDSIYWKSWGNRKQYSKFPANIILTLSEQDENYQAQQLELKVNNHKEIILQSAEGIKIDYENSKANS
jgi:DNA-binding transcriptional ArsR family regulator